MPPLKVMIDSFPLKKIPWKVNFCRFFSANKPSNSSSVIVTKSLIVLIYSSKLETNGQMEAANPKLPCLYGGLGMISVNFKEIKPYLGSGS